ncbi:unnamed protein product, partial [Rotaria sp. Silwood2]
ESLLTILINCHLFTDNDDGGINELVEDDDDDDDDDDEYDHN